MNKKFNAQIVEIIRNEVNILIIGFFEDDRYENTVILQYQDYITEEEIGLRWTQYYLEVNPPGKGAYDCISYVKFSNDRLEIGLNSNGQKHFKLQTLTIEYSVPPDLIVELKSNLDTIFSKEQGVDLKVI